MKVRIRFAKFSVVKFIGHLDVMRYFQKAIRRACIDVAYSTGFNPHQIMSFASPLGVGVTSDGEYVDIEVNSMTSTNDMKNALNQQMNEGFAVTGIEILKEPKPNEKKETAMSQIAAADYMISLKDGYTFFDQETLEKKLQEFYAQKEIVVLKKSKKSEHEMDIRRFIYGLWFKSRGYGIEHADLYENGVHFFVKLATGSVINIRPDLILEAFCAYAGVEYNEYAFQIHRMEMYANAADNKMSMEEMIAAVKEGKELERKLVPLLNYGIQE